MLARIIIPNLDIEDSKSLIDIFEISKDKEITFEDLEESLKLKSNELGFDYTECFPYFNLAVIDNKVMVIDQSMNLLQEGTIANNERKEIFMQETATGKNFSVVVEHIQNEEDKKGSFAFDMIGEVRILLVIYSDGKSFFDGPVVVAEFLNGGQIDQADGSFLTKNKTSTSAEPKDYSSMTFVELAGIYRVYQEAKTKKEKEVAKNRFDYTLSQIRSDTQKKLENEKRQKNRAPSDLVAMEVAEKLINANTKNKEHGKEIDIDEVIDKIFVFFPSFKGVGHKGVIGSCNLERGAKYSKEDIIGKIKKYMIKNVLGTSLGSGCADGEVSYVDKTIKYTNRAKTTSISLIIGIHPITGHLNISQEIKGKDRVIICLPLLNEDGNLLNRVMVLEFYEEKMVFLYPS